MTLKHMIAPNQEGEGQSHSLPERTDNSRTRRDLMAMVFGCTAAVAFGRIHTSSEASPDDVFDGGTP